MLITCAHCGTSRDRPTGEVNRAVSAGKPLYCSRDCGNAARSARRKSAADSAWHLRMFEQRPTAIETACVECGRAMWLPASKVGLYTRCSADCKAAPLLRNHDSRRRQCETCGVEFLPRPTQIRQGHGRFCSQQCNTAGRAVITSPEMLAFAQQRRREKHAAGLIPWKTGPDHHSWKGGLEAARQRLRDTGLGAQRLRAYRAKNPHKVREFAARRAGRKLGRLEYGSIPRIGAAQRWKCAICRVSVRDHYDVDHIVPLARGGKHRARNIQLLCRPCNVRKSAKDPMDYMRQIGRLL